MKSLKSINVKLPTSISPMAKWIATILILGVGVVLVVFLYVQEQGRNTDLKDGVNSASGTLVQNSLKKRDLENRLVAANLGLAELSAQFPASQYTMDVEELLFSAAADAGVELSGITCAPPKGEAVGGVTYQVFSTSVVVTGGSEEDVLRFLGRLGYWLPSASVQSTTVDGGTMNLTLKVYAWGS